MGLRQQLNFFSRKVKNSLPLYNFHDIAKALAIFSEDTNRRSEIRQNYIGIIDKLVGQPYPYKLLQTYANDHPFLRIVHGARIREVLKNGVLEPYPKFAKKCTQCGEEFKKPPKKTVDNKDNSSDAPNEDVLCPSCGGLLRDPNPQEKKYLEAFLKNPNRDDETRGIIISIMKDNLSVDDWYLSVYNVPGTNQFAVYVEDASEIFICGDEHSRLGNGEYFCPQCWSKDNHPRYRGDWREATPPNKKN